MASFGKTKGHGRAHDTTTEDDGIEDGGFYVVMACSHVGACSAISMSS